MAGNELSNVQAYKMGIHLICSELMKSLHLQPEIVYELDSSDSSDSSGDEDILLLVDLFKQVYFCQ